MDVNDLRSQISTLTQQMQQQAAEYSFNTTLRSAAQQLGALDEADVIALLPDKTTLRDSGAAGNSRHHLRRCPGELVEEQQLHHRRHRGG